MSNLETIQVLINKKLLKCTTIRLAGIFIVNKYQLSTSLISGKCYASPEEIKNYINYLVRDQEGILNHCLTPFEIKYYKINKQINNIKRKKGIKNKNHKIKYLQKIKRNLKKSINQIHDWYDKATI